MDLLDQFRAYVETEAGERAVMVGLAILAAIGVFLLWVFGVLGKILKFFFAKEEKKADPVAPIGHVILTVDDLVAKLEEQRDKAKAELGEAHEDEKAQLTAQIAEYEKQLADPDAALVEAQKTIAELTDRLERMGNDIGGDRLQEARDAFQRLDYSVADDIFAEVEERQKLEVQKAARAAYGRGEIAEAKVRWHDAANHYQRAARLDPGYDTLGKAGEFLRRSGRYADAIRQDEELVSLSRIEFGDQDERTSVAVTNLAESYRSLGRYTEAEPLIREGLAITEQALGKEHAEYAIRLNNLAVLLRATGRYDEAEPLYREALAVTEQALGKEHAEYATSLNNLAELLRATGRYDEAEPLYREALAVTEQALGKEHADYAQSLNNLALLLDATDRFDAAEPLYREAVQVVEAALGADHPTSKTVRENLEIFLAERVGE